MFASMPLNFKQKRFSFDNAFVSMKCINSAWMFMFLCILVYVVFIHMISFTNTLYFCVIYFTLFLLFFSFCSFHFFCFMLFGRCSVVNVMCKVLCYVCRHKNTCCCSYIHKYNALGICALISS